MSLIIYDVIMIDNSNCFSSIGHFYFLFSFSINGR